jgi:fructan beta-fructosidase
VALITADGNGQRIKLAYSEDEGKTWTKVDKVVADWSRDPLGSMDFRDPKVFRWEGKWFMVIAGGPLRIYSSENLVDWKCESTYANLHTECPDMYPITASDGTLKWVLSRGGRLYKVGDFKEVDGNWTFVPDSEYQDADGVMNFGKDSYAAMTFYEKDFGTAANPTLPDIIEINWMNTWDDYCNSVAEKVGQKFNGTYNLALKEGLVKDGDSYLLTQTPVDAYKLLRTDPVVELKGVDVTAGNDLLKDFAVGSHLDSGERCASVHLNVLVLETYIAHFESCIGINAQLKVTVKVSNRTCGRTLHLDGCTCEWFTHVVNNLALNSNVRSRCF